MTKAKVHFIKMIISYLNNPGHTIEHGKSVEAIAKRVFGKKTTVRIISDLRHGEPFQFFNAAGESVGSGRIVS